MTYCKVQIVLLLSEGSAAGSPSLFDKSFPELAGVDRGVVPSILVRFNKLIIYLV